MHEPHDQQDLQGHRASMARNHGNPVSQSPRPSRSAEELAEMMRHIGYEVLSCAMCTRLLRVYPVTESAPLEDPRTTVYNALLEAQLIHARNVIELLVRPLPPQPGHDDLLRTDFGPDWTPTPPASGAHARLSQAWEPINKHLAHLSWTRAKSGKAWRTDHLGTDTLTVARAWNEHVAVSAPVLASALRPYLVWAQKTQVR
jgi:hypothetical protein